MKVYLAMWFDKTDNVEHLRCVGVFSTDQTARAFLDLRDGTTSNRSTYSATEPPRDEVHQFCTDKTAGISRAWCRTKEGWQEVPDWRDKVAREAKP